MERHDATPEHPSDNSRAASVKPPVCLTIAGFDPSSGAGVTADLKTFAAFDVYGVAAITALTVQSTQGVRAVEPVSPDLLRETLSCLAADVTIAAVKIGMLANAALVRETARFLENVSVSRECIVLDPVCRSSSGRALLTEDDVAELRGQLLPRVGWITPNLDELAVLTGMPVATERAAIEEQAARLAALAGGSEHLGVVATGGHLTRPDDYILWRGEGHWLEGERIETRSTHGTGCALSSALAAGLASGMTGNNAVRGAKQFVTEALRAAYPVGQGRGPMHHLFRLGVGA